MSRTRTVRVALYVRVSTTGQTVENQTLELSKVAEARGWQVVNVYQDAGISGAKGRDQRPGFDAALKGAVRGEYDLLMAWDVSRLGRSLADLANALKELHTSGRGLYLHVQGMDTTTPAGRAMFQMCGVFAEFEREMIRERINAGIARVKATGKTKTGNPTGRPKTDDTKRDAILEAFAQGMPQRAIAAQVGVGLGTVQRTIKASVAAAQAAAVTA